MKALLALAAAVLLAAGPAAAQDAGKLRSLRGDADIPATNPSPQTYRMTKNDRLVPRDFAKQPPVIPHNIKGYQITRNVNMCMSCHSRKMSGASGATAVGRSHYLDRDEKVLRTVSARRYFCLQCHVPQHDVEPLVGNTFKGAN